MTGTDLYAALRRRGVVLSVERERLAYDAPPGALTPELRAAMRAQKAELMAAVVAAEDARVLDRLDERYADDGAEPGPLPDFGPWAMDQTVRNILALSPGDLARYRLALAHDVEALRRADVARARAAAARDGARLNAAVAIFDAEIVERGPDGQGAPVAAEEHVP